MRPPLTPQPQPKSQTAKVVGIGTIIGTGVAGAVVANNPDWAWVAQPIVDLANWLVSWF